MSQYQSVFRELGIDAEAVFDHPSIKPWRTLKDRENCRLDATLADGRSIRWHVKRNISHSAARDEMQGLKLLQEAQIPTVPLVAFGELNGGKSFIITEDLSGYQPADKLLESGFSFDRLREPLAELAAKLHNAGLHHRDLYLCHFFVKNDGDQIDLKLIDVACVKKLPTLITRQRWIVKDLAQFWYSMLPLNICDSQRQTWLKKYAELRGEVGIIPLKRAVEKKPRRSPGTTAASEKNNQIEISPFPNKAHLTRFFV